MSLNVLFRVNDSGGLFIPPVIDDKMTYILVMQFSVATDGAVHTGLVLLLKKMCLD